MLEPTRMIPRNKILVGLQVYCLLTYSVTDQEAWHVTFNYCLVKISAAVNFLSQ